MLYYKIDVLKALKDKGYSTTRIRKEKLINESALTAIRHNKPIHWTTIDKICMLLDCQPNLFLGYSREEQTQEQAEEDPEEQNAEDPEEQTESIRKQYTAIMFKNDTFTEFRDLATTESLELFNKWAVDNVNKKWKLQDITQEIFKSFINWCDME